MPSNLREIARATGFSTATVSLALREIGRIPAATRLKVRAAADALGYEANPILSKALSMIRHPVASRYRENLAFLTEFSLDDPHLDPYPYYLKSLFLGASEGALRRGYKLESFTLSGRPADHRRLSRVLQARGIRGLIVIPRVMCDQPRLSFNWEHFASVEIGRTLWYPRNLHHVETADYFKIIEALHILKKAGYHRIGMAVEPTQNKHQRGAYYAAYLLQQSKIPPAKCIPIAAATGHWCEKTFQSWMTNYEPEVLIVHDADAINGWLKNMGLKVPRDISLFHVNARKDNLSGLRRDYHGMGCQAVEMVSLLLESEELGLKVNPRFSLVDEFWQVGTTMSRSIAPYLKGKLALNKESDQAVPIRK